MSLEMALLAEARDKAAVLAVILELIFWPARVLTTARGPPWPVAPFWRATGWTGCGRSCARPNRHDGQPFPPSAIFSSG